MRTRSAGIASSNPTRVIIIAPLMREAMGNRFIKSISLEKKLRACLWFVLRLKSSMQCSLFSHDFFDEISLMENVLSTERFFFFFF